VHFRSIDLTLDRVRRVAHVLGLPASARYVTVAGTNGKGSSVAFLESIYRAAGYRTGAYTSPHLVRYNERVRVDGAPLDDEPLIDAFAAVEAARASIPLTYFEFGTLAALHALRKFPLDVVILEVGMGGRLDAVNVVDADAALVTSVGLDHQQWLGATREKIAGEKAGVLRHGGRAVTSDEHPPATLLRVAEARRCNLWCLGRDFTAAVRGRTWDWLWCGAPAAAVAGVTGIALPEQGVHQLNNAAGAVAVVRQFESVLPVADRDIVGGIASARVPGRLQRVSGAPPMVLDVSHNTDGLAVLAGWLDRHPVSGRRLGVFSMLADKDIAGSLRHVAPHIDHWFLAPLDNPRAADLATLTAAVESVSAAPVDGVPNIVEAAERARAAAREGDEVVVFGSFYAVGDIMRGLRLEPYPASR